MVNTNREIGLHSGSSYEDTIPTLIMKKNGNAGLHSGSIYQTTVMKTVLRILRTMTAIGRYFDIHFGICYECTILSSTIRTKGHVGLYSGSCYETTILILMTVVNQEDI
ncbi:hypothetical protein CaCOL14_005822 [Colletotrichum acutatum]